MPRLGVDAACITIAFVVFNSGFVRNQYPAIVSCRAERTRRDIENRRAAIAMRGVQTDSRKADKDI